eukprot:5692382-Pyramimonas_sp.AAC.1
MPSTSTEQAGGHAAEDVTPGSKKKKQRVTRAAQGDKGGKGLRHFSLKVSERAYLTGKVGSTLKTAILKKEYALRTAVEPYNTTSQMIRFTQRLPRLIEMNASSL